MPPLGAVVHRLAAPIAPPLPARLALAPLLAVALAVGSVPASPAVADPNRLRPPGAAYPLGSERLSDERTLTRWAMATRFARVRVAPRPGARGTSRLRLRTEHGQPEPYLLLRSLALDGRVWIQLRVNGRPNGRRGWVPREALGKLRETRKLLLIDRGRTRATLYRRGRPIWRSRVGVGVRGRPTPRGRFLVRERLRGGLDPLYGPRAFGTSAYAPISDWPRGGVVGIHGTDQPGLIPGRISNGCVRVPNPKVLKLDRKLKIGTPVLIR